MKNILDSFYKIFLFKMDSCSITIDLKFILKTLGLEGLKTNLSIGQLIELIKILVLYIKQRSRIITDSFCRWHRPPPALSCSLIQLPLL